MIALVDIERAGTDRFRCTVECDGARRACEVILSRGRPRRPGTELSLDELNILKISRNFDRDFADYSGHTRYYLMRMLFRAAMDFDEGKPLELPIALDPANIILARDEIQKPHSPPRVFDPDLVQEVLFWKTPRPRPGLHVFRSREEMAAEWAAQGGGRRKMPEVDFDKYLVVAVFWDIEQYEVHPDIVDLRRTGDRLEAVVDPRFEPHIPVPILNPNTVLLVTRFDGPVIFVDRDGTRLGAEDQR